MYTVQISERPSSPEARASSQSRAGISCALAGAVKDGVGGLQHVPQAQPLCPFKVYAKTFRPPITLAVCFIEQKHCAQRNHFLFLTLLKNFIKMLSFHRF